MIENKLEELGLSRKEILVYLCILQYQKILPTRISKLTNVNRPTVYSVAKELIRKGLIAEDITGTNKYFIALDVMYINNLLKKKEEEFLSIKNKLPSIIDTLKQIPQKGNYSVPKIKFIDEPSLSNFLKQESLKWVQSAEGKDKTWWGFQDHTLLNHYKEWADYFWKTFPKDIKLNIFTNKKEVETKIMTKQPYKNQRNIKFLENNSEFTATNVVFGDYILFIMTRERPHYLIEIYNPVMAENMRQLFKRLWNDV